MDRLVGVISDTHGLLRPEAIRALRGCSQIIHAGDVGKPELLEDFGRLAPTVAVRGNVDCGGWARTLPLAETFSIAGVQFHVLHDLQALESQPAPVGTCVVISGHSHQARIVEKGSVLYLNPGAAGPRRFRLPVTLAHLEIGPGERVRAQLIDLLAPSATPAAE